MPYPDREWLYNEYVVLNKTRKQIAKENNVSEATIKSHLYKKRIIKRQPLITKEELEDAYLKNNFTFSTMCEIFECSEPTIREYLKKYNIPRRVNSRLLTEEDENKIIEEYVDNKHSAYWIEKNLNFSHTTVKYILQNHGYEPRNMQEAQWNSNNKEIPEELKDINKLLKLYLNDKKSLKEIGQLLNCDPRVIKNFLLKNNIHIRNNSESKIGLMVGEKHPNWQGGITALSARCREFFNINLAPLAKQRDKKCQLCGSTEHLHVHHIISFSEIVRTICAEHPELDVQKDINELYDIITKDPRFLDIDNLITYCRDCHFYKIHKYNKSTSSEDE